MREILFRGKQIPSGEWIKGSLVHQTEYYGYPVDNYHIVHGGEFDGDYYDSDTVYPKTIGQFTGMLDKNGQKIFEGDIFDLCYTNSKGKEMVVHYVVTYDDEVGVWQPFGDSGCGFDPRHIEIIGNIHDNPELLEDKNK